MNDNSIIAIIVTYNRKALLGKCLDAIRSQTIKPSRILIIDNASTDGTKEMVKEWSLEGSPSIDFISLAKNTGGAGGFNIGIRSAYKLNADWVWVMDDDCIPEPECLERLIAAPLQLPDNIRDNIGFLASRVLWRDRTPCLMNLPSPHHLWIESHAYTPNLTRLSASSFVSMLISRRAIETFGLPVKEFFIWFDDSEYSRRISSEMPCYLISDSIAIHETGQNFTPLDFNQLSDESLWKFSYGVRNEASFHFEKDSFAAGAIFCLRVLTQAMRHSSSWHHRLGIAKACWRGFRFRYTRFIEYIQ